jgi:hypothetical protein
MPDFYSKVVGMSFYKNAENILRALQHGEPLELVREPNNPYHRWAVAVFDLPNKLGHLPWMDAEVIGPLMDLGVTMQCVVWRKPPHLRIRWNKQEAIKVQKQLRALKQGAPKPKLPEDEEVPF